MPVNWQDKAVQDRLLTAVIASVDNKINITDIARLCGGEMGYHAVENYLRKFRRDARAMNGNTPAATSSPVKSTAARTPKKARKASPVKEGVKGARVEKKKAATPRMKKEVLEDEVDEILYGIESAEENGFQGEI
ncbi:hypothetical protein DE146DRAFT_180904 [Phaeosphaeria sp. MPI-PUGE-AT-0046c]|nr:hypothetical protein DE146DRAFT_180904 [Phaeosphaeria sp. MPI-PUGE-AT-0046c]